MRKHKKVIFILGHSGKDLYREAARVAMNCPNVYLDTSTLSYRRTQIVYERVGAEKLVYASDIPYSHPEVEYVKFNLILGKNLVARQKIFRDNPIKILGGLP